MASQTYGDGLADIFGAEWEVPDRADRHVQPELHDIRGSKLQRGGIRLGRSDAGLAAVGPCQDFWNCSAFKLSCIFVGSSEGDGEGMHGSSCAVLPTIAGINGYNLNKDNIHIHPTGSRNQRWGVV